MTKSELIFVISQWPDNITIKLDSEYMARFSLDNNFAYGSTSGSLEHAQAQFDKFLTEEPRKGRFSIVQQDCISIYHTKTIKSVGVDEYGC